MRSVTPLPVWNAAASAAGWAQRTFASAVALAMRILPADTRIHLRQRLTMYQPLDYSARRLLLRVGTVQERRLRVRSCSKEPETVEWIEQTVRDGDVFYDVGANVGAYALVAASRAAGVRVVAFEPGAETYASLCENIALNGFGERMTALPVALGDVNAIVPFTYGSAESGAARHPGLSGDAPGERIEAKAGFRLDDLMAQLSLPSPTHLKIDVDGAELRVLRGAEHAVTDPALRTVLVETDPESPVGRDVHAILERSGFSLRSRTVRGADTANNIYERQTVAKASKAADGRHEAP